MVAIDPSDAAKQCLQLALFLMRDLQGGQLILAHVDPDLRGKPAASATMSADQNPVLAAAAATAKRQGIQPQCITSTGNTGEEICRLAEEKNVDLLVLGSPDRRPSIAKSFVDLDRLLGASLSDYVRVNATCPVLLARTVA
jgi:nucleotide-binding universal stress UspA family protein